MPNSTSHPFDEPVGSDQLLRMLADNLPDMLWAKDTEGRYLFANRAICNNLLMAESTDEPIGKTDVYFAKREREKHKENPQWHTFGELCFNSDEVTLENMKPMRFEEYGNLKGELVHLEVHKAPFFDNDGNLIGTVGSGRDITRQKQLEAELNKNFDSLKLLLDSTIEALFIFDRDSRCIHANKMATTMTGYTHDKLIGMKAEHLIALEYRGVVNHKLVQEETAPYEIAILKHDGNTLPVLARGKRMELFGQPVRVSSMMDMSDIKQAHRKIEHLAFYDALTNLPNRTLLTERIRQVIKLHDRNHQFSALMMLDLDNFKHVNDTLGHDAGDLLLKAVAKKLKSHLRSSDTVARFGGDEFILLLPELPGSEIEVAARLEQIAETIRQSITDEIDLPPPYNGSVQSSCSIGIVIMKAQDENVQSYLRQADIAMYQAKSAGKNSIRFYNAQMQEQVMAQMQIKRDIADALKADAFELYYQPQVDAQMKIIGAEALCRWNHPQRGLLEPCNFIPFAEGNGQILALGEWVIAQAFRQLDAWARSPHTRELVLSINISAKQFHAPEFMPFITSLIETCSFDPKRLKIELTESIFLKEIDKIIEKMNSLNAFGIEISLDDFGTGFSSLSYLKTLPLSELKIDRGFVNDILEDENDQAIVRATIAIANSMNLAIIAEGVENIEQMQMLHALGCNSFQGYLFGRPVPEPIFAATLMSTATDR